MQSVWGWGSLGRRSGALSSLTDGSLAYWGVGTGGVLLMTLGRQLLLYSPSVVQVPQAKQLLSTHAPSHDALLTSGPVTMDQEL